MSLIWKRGETAPELVSMLETLGEEYPLAESGKGKRLVFERAASPETLRVTLKNGNWTVEHGTNAAAARGAACALAGLEVEERIPFKTFGILLDCSRTGVVTPEYFKRWLRRLALMGYNMAMLYTKDAYQLPGETYFGYMRGAYSQDEIKELDAYSARLGIEMVASIQALGHLEPVLRWPYYRDVKDTDNVILVDEEKSYKLLDKMLNFWSEALSSRRIHLGMDETHDLGRGRFMDKFGYERGFDIYNRHLGRLTEMCGKRGLKPMIWSDMYFRMANKNQDYYDKSTVIPADVKAAIPKEAELVYWDYYHRDAGFYEDWIQRHRGLGKEPVMASGIWTWARMWYDREMTENTVRPCVDACLKTGVRELIFTMWGDDGGYCEFESAFAGMAWAADYSFNGKSDDSRLEKVFQAIFGTSYKLQLDAAELEICSDAQKDGLPLYKIPAGIVLWDDPLMGIIWHEYNHFGENIWSEAAQKLRKTAEKLAPHKKDNRAGHINHAWNICAALAEKIEFRMKLLDAYKRGDRETLRQLSKGVSFVIKAIERLDESFRVQWFRSYKSYGLEVMQIKLAGLCARYRETARRIDEYLDGRAVSIPELDLCPKTIGSPDTRYRMIATGGWFI